MRFVPLMVLVPLAGCFDLDFSGLDFESRVIDVHSDQGQVTIQSCEVSGLLGCSDANPPPAASAVLDGKRVALQARMPGFDFFPAYSRSVTTASPDQPEIGLEIDVARFDVEELPWFDFDVATTPDGTLPRSREVTGTYQEYPGATVTAALATQCGTFQNFQTLPGAAADGKVRFTWPAGLVGTCTHDLRISQTLSDAPENRNIVISVGRTEHLPVTSTAD